MRIWLTILVIALIGAFLAWWFVFKPGIDQGPAADSMIPGSSTLVLEHSSISGLRTAIFDSAGVLNDLPMLRKLAPGIDMLHSTALSNASILVCAGPDSNSFRFIISATSESVSTFRTSFGLDEKAGVNIPLNGFEVTINFPSERLITLSSGDFAADTQESMDSHFTNARNTLSDTCEFSIILRPQAFINEISSTWIESLKTLTAKIVAQEKWIALDLASSKNALWLNGVGLGSQPLELPLADKDILRFIPGNASIAYVKSVKGAPGVQTGIMYCPNDVLDMVEDEDLFLLIKGIDWSLLSEDATEFRGFQIQTTTADELEALIELTSDIDGEMHVLRMGDVGIVHRSVERLRNIAEHFLADDRLVHNEQMQRSLIKLSDASSTLIVRPMRLGTELNKLTGKETSEIQLITLQSFNDLPGQSFYNVGVLHHLDSKSLMPTEWTLELDTTAVSGPWRFTNHTNNQAEFLVQDARFELYLVDANGRLLWKRRLDGSITGNIAEVDAYFNGKNQILLNTERSVYLIDRKGRDVEGFPIASRSSANAMLVNYSKEKTRILVPSGKQLLNFDNAGVPVKGWQPKDFDTTIVAAPKLVSFNSKDYLLVETADNKLHFLDPTGKARQKPIALEPGYDRLFVSDQIFGASVMLNHDSLGNINRTRLDGKTEVKNILPLGPSVRMQPFIMDGIQHYAVLDGARYLTLNDEFQVILDYTLPENCDELEHLQYQQRDYIRVTNASQRSTYIFLPKSGLIQNMPILGSGSCILSDTSVPGSPRVIICDGHSLIAYKPVLSAL